MRSRSPQWRPLFTLLTVLCGGAGPALAIGSLAATGEAPSRLFLKLRAAAVGKPHPALERLLGMRLEAAQPLSHRPGPQPGGLDRLYSIPTAPGADVPALAAKLARLPEVEYAEPVPFCELAAVPNDPQYPAQQAYLANLQAAAAWDVQQSGNAVPRPVVCIVDGGTNIQHEDLAANLWVNPGEIPGNLIDDDDNGFIDDVNGWNFRDNSNNPRGSASTPGNANHGSHTAGLAAAVTNNGVGIACASWNPLLMAVNASGNSDGSIAWGYEGIAYAAENGADVVSLSWGGTGGSLAAQDIIDFATAQGTLVVAAAGNNNSNKRFYPAAYERVIAVANVTVADVRYSGPSGSNYGGWLDVAAPGTSVYSTFDMTTTNAYGSSTGTSMACPVAAGVAALIQARHPSWGPLEVGEQLRMTCDNINAANPGFADQLGRGRINAFRAVTETPPAVRALTWSFSDPNGDGKLNQGESVTMTLQVHNYLTAAVNPQYALSTPSPWITITDGTHSGATLPDDGDATLTNAFAFTVHPDAPPGTALDVRLDFSATGYTDFQYLPLTLEPVFANHDVNRLRLSLTGTGGIGWIGFPSGLGDEGIGLSFDGGPNLLFEGALLLGTSAGHLSDAARTTGERTDFAPELHSPPRASTPGTQAAQEIHAAFTDSLNVATPLGVQVALSSWASATAPHNDFVVVEFNVKNRTAAAFDSLWAAVWFDWDIDEQHFETNQTAYDAGRRLGYAWDPAPGLPYVGIMALSGATAAFSAIDNNGPGPVVLTGLGGFSKAEKWDVLQAGTGIVAAGPDDISNALSTGPYGVPVGSSAAVFFALLAAPDLPGLQAAADRARVWFADSVTTDAGEIPGVRVPVAALGVPVPNPFNPTTRIELVVRAARDVHVDVYDVQGRHVVTLASGPRSPGRYPLFWSGTDDGGHRVASGVYMVRLQADGVEQTRRVVLAK